MSAESDSVECAMRNATRLTAYRDEELWQELKRRYPVMCFVGETAQDESGNFDMVWYCPVQAKVTFALLHRFLNEILNEHL